MTRLLQLLGKTFMSIAEHNKIIIGKSSLTYRYNTWDQKAFGKKLSEIVQIDSDKKDLESLFKTYSDHCSENHIDISIVRIREEDRQKRKALEKEGFRMKEVSYNISASKKRLNSNQFYTSIQSRLTKFENEFTSSCNEKDLLNLSNEMFNHGRFVEDPDIELQLSHKRHNQWALDLLNGKSEKIFLKRKGELIAFMFYREESNEVTLELGGVSGKYPHLVPTFWVHVLSCLSENAKINTCISATNTGVLNLYINLGFKVTQALVGYHKLNK